MEAISAWFESRGIPPIVAGALMAVAVWVLFKLMTRSRRQHDYGAGLAGPARMPGSGRGGPGQAGLGQAELASLLARASTSVVQDHVKQVPGDAMHEAVRLIRAGNKIEAIKRVREATGLGLKEAKDVVDRISSALPD